MSKEKLYAVKNEEGEWLSLDDMKTRIWYSNSPTIFNDKSYAEDQSIDRKAHVVELIEKPEPVVVSEEEAEALKNAERDSNTLWSLWASSSVLFNDRNQQVRLIRAYVNGWTVEKPKRYVLPMPGTDYHNIQMHGNAQYYAVKGTGNWRPDAIALGTDDAVKHGYTVTQSDIDAAPDWVKSITPIEVTDDD